MCILHRYWRETMRVLIRRKFGDKALGTSELARDWSVIDHIGHLSVMQMCGPPLTSVPHVGTHTSVDRKCAHTHARTHTRTHAHTHTHTHTSCIA